ncbi:MAG TPA: glycosyltransferase family 87 protein [Candidatus Limnocylindria bacterium]|nr:glycosyltransferase family 87 protein [Candidatus Limnocylindria bacterium]
MEPPRPPLRLVPGGSAAASPITVATPPFELAALGTGLVLTTAMLARRPAWAAELGTFQALFAVAFVFYAVALLRIRRLAMLPNAPAVVLIVAFAARIALLPVAPTLSDDVYRYVWEGKVAAHGSDPYRQTPADPALAPLRDRVVHPRLNHPQLATIYPPLSIAGFALVAWLSPTVWAMKLWVVLHDLALIVALLMWARARGASAWPVMAYAWNPLVLIEYAGNGHNDPTALLWLVLALMWAERRPLLSAGALSAGALVKLVPLLALPFLLRRWPWRARVLCLGLLAAGLGWFWIATRGADSGLTAYWRAWRNNELVFHYLVHWTGGFAAARTLALALVAIAIAFALVRRWSAANGTRLALRTSLLVSPVVHPWYLGWALALEPLGPSAPWLLLSLTAVLSYGLLAPPLEGGRFHLPLAWRWVEYGVPMALAVTLGWKHRHDRSRGPSL